MKLDISNRNLTTLFGIEFKDNITVLDCSYNRLKSLKYLPSTITTLICSHNHLISLKNCPPQIKYLYCSNNQLTSLQYCPLEIIELSCYDNQITSLKYLNHSKNLKELFCNNNQLTSLKYCPIGLIKLYCQCNKLTSLKYCPSFVIELDCYNNRLTSLKYLPSTTKILLCSYSQLTLLNFVKRSDKLKLNVCHELIKSFKLLKDWKTEVFLLYCCDLIKCLNYRLTSVIELFYNHDITNSLSSLKYCHPSLDLILFFTKSRYCSRKQFISKIITIYLIVTDIIHKLRLKIMILKL